MPDEEVAWSEGDMSEGSQNDGERATNEGVSSVEADWEAALRKLGDYVRASPSLTLASINTKRAKMVLEKVGTFRSFRHPLFSCCHEVTPSDLDPLDSSTKHVAVHRKDYKDPHQGPIYSTKCKAPSARQPDDFHTTDGDEETVVFNTVFHNRKECFERALGDLERTYDLAELELVETVGVPSYKGMVRPCWACRNTGYRSSRDGSWERNVVYVRNEIPTTEVHGRSIPTIRGRLMEAPVVPLTKDDIYHMWRQESLGRIPTRLSGGEAPEPLEDMEGVVLDHPACLDTFASYYPHVQYFWDMEEAKETKDPTRWREGRVDTEDVGISFLGRCTDIGPHPLRPLKEASAEEQWLQFSKRKEADFYGWGKEITLMDHEVSSFLPKWY